MSEQYYEGMNNSGSGINTSRVQHTHRGSACVTLHKSKQFSTTLSVSSNWYTPRMDVLITPPLGAASRFDFSQISFAA